MFIQSVLMYLYYICGHMWLQVLLVLVNLPAVRLHFVRRTAWGIKPWWRSGGSEDNLQMQVHTCKKNTENWTHNVQQKQTRKIICVLSSQWMQCVQRWEYLWIPRWLHRQSTRWFACGRSFWPDWETILRGMYKQKKFLTQNGRMDIR